MTALINEIRGWFEACGYDVSETVGRAAGEVDRFATQRRGLMPPRTWWTVVETFPSDLDSAIEKLDMARIERGADRALAIVTNDVTPAGYRPDLNAGVASYVTLRFLALHLAGVVHQLSEMAREEPEAPYFPHRIRLPSGETADACARRVRVTDNGSGVRPDDRERIFEPFVTTKKGGAGPRGTGLGLPIARKFAERMGARVALESSNGATIFEVIFVAGGPP